MKTYNILELQKMNVQELTAIAFSEFSIIPHDVTSKQILIYQILDQQQLIIQQNENTSTN